MKVPLIVMLALVATIPQGKMYSLKLEWKPVAGYKSELSETTSMKMTFTGAGQPSMINEERTSFAATEEVASATADGGSELIWRFSEATQFKDGRMVPLGFQGKTVRVKHLKGQPRTFSLDGGGAIGDEDLAVLKKAFMGGEDKPGEPTGADIFAPKAPVRVGESWSPDLRAVATGMFDADVSLAVDLTKSRSTFTLVSVEARSGADYGRMDGLLELALGQLGPMRLDTPIPLKMTVTGDFCIDGTRPDGVIRMEMSMKGASSFAGPAGKIPVDLDMTMNAQKTVRTVK